MLEPEELDPLEAAVLNKLLAGGHPVLEGLRDQLEHIAVKERQLTGVGFYTTFRVSDAAVPVAMPVKALRFGDVEARITGLANPAGFLLCVEDGLLKQLEGYSRDEGWPARVGAFTLSYSDPSRAALLESLG